MEVISISKESIIVLILAGLILIYTLLNQFNKYHLLFKKTYNQQVKQGQQTLSNMTQYPEIAHGLQIIGNWIMSILLLTVITCLLYACTKVSDNLVHLTAGYYFIQWLIIILEINTWPTFTHPNRQVSKLSLVIDILASLAGWSVLILIMLNTI